MAYKTDAYGSTLILADRWFPSSRLCCQCGMLHETLTLKDRVFVCGGWCHTEDRDVHAAKNLERYPGLQGNLNACGLPGAGQHRMCAGETQ
jgi:putative transposase